MTAVGGDALISAQENRRMFDGIAQRYDLLNALMSLGLQRRWRHQAIRTVLSGSGSDFLDVGCGTGDMALALLRRSPTARLTGIDFSTAMVSLAIAKTREAGLEARAHYQIGDATSLPMGNGSFDGITCAFCLRNIVDRAAAFREMRRVLRPGGTVAILELTKPAGTLAGLAHRLYIRRLVPLLGALLSRGSAYRYLAASIDNFPPAPEIVAAMERAGFVHSESTPLTGGFVTLFSGRAPDARRGEAA